MGTFGVALAGFVIHPAPMRVGIERLGDADAERYRAASEIVLADENVDGLLVLLTPQAMTDPTACAEGVVAAARCWPS